MNTNKKAHNNNRRNDTLHKENKVNGINGNVTKRRNISIINNII